MAKITRKGDSTNGHPGASDWVPTVSDAGSPTVFTNGIAVVRVGDHFTTHQLSYAPLAPHDSVSAQGSTTVFAEKLAVMRVGDETSCSDTVAVGSPDVFAG